MKSIKTIFVTLVVAVGLYYAYFQLSTEKTPQECYTYQESYNEVLNLIKQKNTDGSLDATLRQLSSVGNQLDSALSGDKRFKKEDAKNLRNMCVNNHQLNQQILTMIKSL